MIVRSVRHAEFTFIKTFNCKKIIIKDQFPDLLYFSITEFTFRLLSVLRLVLLDIIIANKKM